MILIIGAIIVLVLYTWGSGKYLPASHTAAYGVGYIIAGIGSFFSLLFLLAGLSLLAVEAIEVHHAKRSIRS